MAMVWSELKRCIWQCGKVRNKFVQVLWAHPQKITWLCQLIMSTCQPQQHQQWCQQLMVSPSGGFLFFFSSYNVFISLFQLQQSARPPQQPLQRRPWQSHTTKTTNTTLTLTNPWAISSYSAWRNGDGSRSSSRGLRCDCRYVFLFVFFITLIIFINLH